LCATYGQEDWLVKQAESLNLKIPEPIVVSEIGSKRIMGSPAADKDLLIDEAPMVLQFLLNSLGMNGEVKAMTLTAPPSVERRWNVKNPALDVRTSSIPIGTHWGLGK
jgi:hypothetical protein